VRKSFGLVANGKNESNLILLLVQTCFQALCVFCSLRTGAGLGQKECGAGAGWEGLRGVLGGRGQDFSNSCRAGLNFAGARRERTKNFNPRRTLIPSGKSAQLDTVAASNRDHSLLLVRIIYIQVLSLAHTQVTRKQCYAVETVLLTRIHRGGMNQ